MFKILIIIFTFLLSLNLFAVENLFQVLERYQIDLESVEDSILELPILKVIEKNINERELELKVYIENSTDFFVVHRNDYETIVIKDEKGYQVITKTFEGSIRGTLFDTILADLKDESVANIISVAFKEDFITTKGLRVDATYSMTAEVIFEGDEITSFGNISNAKVIVGKAVVEKVLINDPERKSLVLTNMIPDESERIFVSPVGTDTVSSVFNLARRHPVKKRIQPHNGIDFKARSGTSVFPALEGEVINIGKTRAKGKFVQIRHANGFETTYDHFRKFQKGLHVGMHVDTRDQIGEVGKTGLATGAHLHFGMLKNGQYVNPLYYFKDYRLTEEKERALDELES
jgi:murein DD-endopeptidase MepM/ murein hydrolase activator NlpD